MRLSPLAAIFCFCVLKFARPLDDFDDEVDFAERMDQLKEMCADEGYVRFNEFYLEDYLEWSSRNYSFLLLFVASAGEARCQDCKEAIDEFAIVAKSLRLAAGTADRVFAGVVDYDRTPGIFYRLLVRHIPSVALVAADHKLTAAKAAPQMKWQRSSAEAIGEWLATVANVRLQIVRPADYERVYQVVAAFAVGALLLVAWRVRQRIWSRSRTVAALLAVGFCSLMVSGHMFNRIHRTPFSRRSERGLGLISRDSNFQFACETYLIGAAYLGFGGCVIAVVEGRMRANWAANATVAVALLFAALCYTFVVSSFRFKMDVYPFSGLAKVERYF